MAVITPVVPALAYAARTFSTLTASDTVPLQGASRYMLHFKNTTGGAISPVIVDPTSQTPAGATAFNPSVTEGPIPATTGEGYAYISNSDRFRDSSGNMTITGGTGAQVTVIGPLA